MRNFYFALLPIALFFPLLSQAQSNYKPGYVVTLKRDTLHGFIDYKEWNLSPEFINFKKNISDKPLKFTPDSIVYFDVNGQETYQLYSGLISIDHTDIEHIPSGRNTRTREASVFLKIVQKGPNLVLFSYTDDIKSRFYIAEAPDYALKELVYRTYMTNDISSGAGKSVTENTYMRQLYASAQKYNVLTDEMQVNIEHMSYSGPDIMQIVSKINGITESGSPNKKALNKNGVFFLGAALNISTNTHGIEREDAAFKSHTSYLPMVSLGVDIAANPNIDKLIFRIELSLAGSEYKSAYANNNAPYANTTYSYNNLAFALRPQIIYNFYNTDNTKFFGDIGIALTANSYTGAAFKNQAGTIVQTPSNSINLSTINIPIILKAGALLHKNIEIYAGYLTSTSSTGYSVFKLSSSSIQTGINYEFR